MTLPPFVFVCVHGTPISDGPAAEGEWIARCARSGRSAAHLWQGASGLIVPRNATTEPGWPRAQRAHAVQVRASGGGVVPQGPGVLNLSLLWPAATDAPAGTEAVYEALCTGLAAALARLGIAASPQAVSGSFCDGRFNLAVDGRKLAGTAQSWRRSAGRLVVLAHAVLIVGADPVELTEAANAFERDLGSGRIYRADALTSVDRAWQAVHARPPPPDLQAQLANAIAERFARAPIRELSVG